MTETTSMTKKSKKPSTPKLFPDELIDQLLAQIVCRRSRTRPSLFRFRCLVLQNRAQRQLVGDFFQPLVPRPDRHTRL